MDQILITPAGLLDLLSQIDELKEVNVGVSETLDNNLQIEIGSSTYIIDAQEATEIQAPPRVVDQIDTANEEAYADLADAGQIEFQEPVTSGILKEIAKTLLVGGLVRLTKKLLSK